jgi:oligoribonuclease
VWQQHWPGSALSCEVHARSGSVFHYRNLDVSTLKELAKRWRPEVYNSFKKQQRHTALADVQESIDEMEHYREHFLKLAA